MHFTSVAGACAAQSAHTPTACPVPHTPSRLVHVSRTPAPASHPPGHLLSHEFGPAFKKWHSCPAGDLITKADLCVQVRDNNARMQAMLQEEARSADWLLLWLDCDREGEAICEEVLRLRCSPRAFARQALTGQPPCR